MILGFRWLVLPQALPFGGVKDSGYGRFAGPEGLRACCLLKSVTVDRFPNIMGTVVPAPLQVYFLFTYFELDLILHTKSNTKLETQIKTFYFFALGGSFLHTWNWNSTFILNLVNKIISNSKRVEKRLLFFLMFEGGLQWGFLPPF